MGEIGLCDPTKSGSIAQAFVNVIQQQIHRRVDPLGGAGGAAEAAAVRQGWQDAMRLLQLVGANARYFTDTSQKPPIDVADGDCAAGMCIDFYGREQQEAVRRRNPGPDRVAYVAPDGGSAYSVDPIALLRGAPHPGVALAFIEYTLSLDGQKLWNFRTGTPGGPQEFALRRLPVRRDFYSHADWAALRSDPDVNPYAQKKLLVYNDAWTGALFSPLIFIVRVMTEDTHPGPRRRRGRRSSPALSEPARRRALAGPCRTYRIRRLRPGPGPHHEGHPLEEPGGRGQRSRDRRLGATFRANYQRAERIASGRE